MTLQDLSVGKTAKIITVGGEGALRRRLLDMGLTPRTEITIRKIAPFGDPMELSLRGYALTIRREEAAKIIVEETAQGCGTHTRMRWRGGRA